MPTYTISGIEVEFPKEAYPCQIEYMTKNIQALQQATNALLESPTGTGKTLSLLCSTLAWQKAIRQQAIRAPVKLEYGNGPAAATGSEKPSVKAPQPKAISTIVYASRTHSQLAQVVGELKSTSYAPRMTVLGSRDQLCVHEKISKLRGGALNHACNTANARRTCMYKNHLENYNPGGSGGGTLPPIMDIEEVVQEVGRRDKVCPYFYTRDSSEAADLVLLPYNYLLDSSIRSSLKLNWQHAVVIFDEAHNLEKVASDAASFTLSSAELASCIQELQTVLKGLQEYQSLDKEAAQVAGIEGALKPGKEEPTIQGTVRILRALFEVERRLDDVALTPGTLGRTPSCVQPGAWLCNMLESSGLSHVLARDNIDEIRRCGNWLMEKAQSALGGGSLTVPEPKLMALASALGRLFRGRSLQESCLMVTDYKVFICEEDTGGGFNQRQSQGQSQGQNQGRTWVRQGSGPGDNRNEKKKRILNFWAFSPGIAMEELKRMGVRSIILTSGTLSPLSAFREDMKLPFPIQLENLHVIKDKQIWVGAISNGFKGKQLNSSYTNRDRDEYKDELGNSILGIIKSMCGSRPSAGFQLTSTSDALTPGCNGPELKGGILVFFPSYGVMESCVARWQQTGLLDALRNSGGAVVVEPKGNSASPAASANSSKSSKGKYDSGKSRADRWSDSPIKKNGAFDSGSNSFSFVTSSTRAQPISEEVSTDAAVEDRITDAVLGGVISEFDAALKERGRCVLMAVCRGKVSEGIDFKDEKGRVVIITGLPFAPHKDPWVELKKQYLDERCVSRLPPSHAPIVPLAAYMYCVDLPSLSPASNPSPYGQNSLNVPKPSPYPNPYGQSHAANHPYGQVITATSHPYGAPLPTPPGTMTSSSQSHPYGMPPSAPGGGTAVTVKSEQKPAYNYPTYPVPNYADVVAATAAAMAAAKASGGSTNASSGAASASTGGSTGANGNQAAKAASDMLTGQGWYTQSASRAINQAVGRVIRHQKDWGAIFLLDDRFHQDRYTTQLSRWVRPRLKKYKQYAPALNEFRRFITQAMEDKELAILPKEIKPLVRDSRIVPEGLRAANNTASATTSAIEEPLKKVVVRASDLEKAVGGEREISYLPPELPLTQAASQAPTQAADVPRTASSSGLASRHNALVVADSTDAEASTSGGEIDLGKLIAKMKPGAAPTPAQISNVPGAMAAKTDPATGKEIKIIRTTSASSNYSVSGTGHSSASSSTSKNDGTIQSFFSKMANTAASTASVDASSKGPAQAQPKPASASSDAFSHPLLSRPKQSNGASSVASSAPQSFGLVKAKAASTSTGGFRLATQTPGNAFSAPWENVSVKSESTQSDASSPRSVPAYSQQTQRKAASVGQSGKGKENVADPSAKAGAGNASLSSQRSEAFLQLLESLKKELGQEQFLRLSNVIRGAKAKGLAKEAQVESFVDALCVVFRPSMKPDAMEKEARKKQRNDLIRSLLRLSVIVSPEVTKSFRSYLIDKVSEMYRPKSQPSQTQTQTQTQAQRLKRALDSDDDDEADGDESQRGLSQSISKNQQRDSFGSAKKPKGSRDGLSRDSLSPLSQLTSPPLAYDDMEDGDADGVPLANQRQPSKRAKMMLALSQSQSTSSEGPSSLSNRLQQQKNDVRKDPKQVFASIDGMMLTQGGKPTSASTTNGSAGISSSTKSLAKACALCKIESNNLLVARCRHVACNGCWTRWLAINNSCPQCRVKTTRAELKALLLKAN